MTRRIVIDGGRLLNKEDALLYVNQLFHFEKEVKGLDSMVDYLSEEREEIEIVLNSKSISKLCYSKYGFKVLMALGSVAQQNPNFKIVFTK